MFLYFISRYPNVSAYDHSRVRLSHNDEDIYINANLVKAPEAERHYILSQGTIIKCQIHIKHLNLICISGPLKETVDDFWLMIFQYNCPTIVMLCNCWENNMNKSWQYWPLEVGHTMVLGEDRDGIELEVTYVHLEDRNHYLVRSFVLTDTASGEKRKVKQFHYLDWPDFNVPKSPKYFLEFLYAIRESGCFSENSGPPVGKSGSINKAL